MNERLCLLILKRWTSGASSKRDSDDLSEDDQPTVVNGSNDVIMSMINSFIMEQNSPKAEPLMYPDPSRVQFQYPELFVGHVVMFLSGAERRPV